MFWKKKHTYFEVIYLRIIVNHDYYFHFFQNIFFLLFWKYVVRVRIFGTIMGHFPKRLLKDAHI